MLVLCYINKKPIILYSTILPNLLCFSKIANTKINAQGLAYKAYTVFYNLFI